MKHQLARLNRQAWSLYRRFARSRARGDLSQARILAAVQWQADHFEDAPVIIVACLHGRPLARRHGPTAAYYGSIFPAAQNLLLAARALGLGAALTTLPLWSRGLARRTLGLPAARHPLRGDPARLAHGRRIRARRPGARSRRSPTSTATGTGPFSTPEAGVGSA